MSIATRHDGNGLEPLIDLLSTRFPNLRSSLDEMKKRNNVGELTKKFEEIDKRYRESRLTNNDILNTPFTY